MPGEGIDAESLLRSLREKYRVMHADGGVRWVHERGLGPALQALVAHSGVPVKLDDRIGERFAPAVETALYYGRLGGAHERHARVTLMRDAGGVEVEVADDGCGRGRPGARAARGLAAARAQDAARIRQVVVPWASSLRVSSAITRPSAVATVRPGWTTVASHRTGPVSRVIARAKLTFDSSVV
jgi:hypothetical protein